MIRSLRVLGLATALASLPALAGAQKAFTVGLSAGASLPIGDLGDGFKMGFAVVGHAYYKPTSMQKLLFRGDLNFDRWSAKNSAVDANARSIGGTANLLYNIGGEAATMSPYIIGGAGFQNFKVTSNTASASITSSATKPAINVGGGLQFALSGFSTFLEVRYVNVFAEGGSNSWVPITFGIHF